MELFTSSQEQTSRSFQRSNRNRARPLLLAKLDFPRYICFNSLRPRLRPSMIDKRTPLHQLHHSGTPAIALDNEFNEQRCLLSHRFSARPSKVIKTKSTYRKKIVMRINSRPTQYMSRLVYRYVHRTAAPFRSAARNLPALTSTKNVNEKKIILTDPPPTCH